MSKKNGWEVALDILGMMAVGAVTMKKAQEEQKIRELTRKPAATDEDVDALIKGLNGISHNIGKARVLSAWSRSRSITVAQLNHICARVKGYKAMLVDAILSEQGISDPENAMSYTAGEEYWDWTRSQTIQKILRQHQA
jgi:hypothetical protein